MAYTIDKDLYAKALTEIRSDYLQRNQLSSEMAERMAASLQSHAERCFATAWHSAIQMQESHKRRAQQLRPQSLPLDQQRLAGLPAEAQESLRRAHAKIEAHSTQSHLETQKLFVDLHQTTLVKLFTTVGVSATTSRCIVDQHIIPD